MQRWECVITEMQRRIAHKLCCSLVSGSCLEEEEKLDRVFLLLVEEANYKRLQCLFINYSEKGDFCVPLRRFGIDI